MRTIGLIGGMSFESSAVYYRLINEMVRDRLGGFASAELLMHSVNFEEIVAMQKAGDWEAAGKRLGDVAARLQSAGADCVLICTNTMHLVADRITDAVGIPFLHIADAAGAAVSGAGLATVGLLGTAFTMEKPFYAEKLAAHGIRTLVPDADDRRTVHAVIYDELVHGVVRDESRRAYVEVVDRLIARGAEGIVLGCTEIELLLSARDVPVPVFPTTSLHVDAAIAAALAD